MPKVTAVILTYNRSALLRRCLQAVIDQVHQCDCIIVVDNGSTDDTLEILKSEWIDRVTIYALPNNIGAAGGFNVGLHLAYQQGADFIWLMDDDVIAEATALERLLKAESFLRAQEISPPYLVSNAQSPEGLPTNTPEIHFALNSMAYSTWPLFLDQCIVPVGRATFVSILLPRETIKQFGLPIADLFIWGEDMEFTMRITRNGPGYLVGNSRVIHVRAAAGAPDVRKETDPRRIKYFYYLKRNQMFMRRRLRHGSVTKHILRQVRLAAELLLAAEYHKAKIVTIGTIHGLFFDPPREHAGDTLTPRGGKVIQRSDRNAATGGQSMPTSNLGPDPALGQSNDNVSRTSVVYLG
jgi:GT2 family glycosyltransferase